MADELPEPQFPAPRVAGEEPVVVERLEPPSELGQAVIAAHLREVHGLRRFRLESHVHLGGPRRRSQRITWNPGKATFICDQCPGVVFWTGEWTDDHLLSAQLFDAGLKPLLSGLNAEECDEMTLLHVRGDINRARLAEAREAAYAAGTASSRPTVRERRLRLQEWMLERYAELGVVARVVEVTEALQRDERALWQELVGRPLAASTIRKNYWNPIDASRKRAAKQRFEQAAKRRKV